MSDLINQALTALKGPHRPSSDYDLNAGVTLPEGRKLRPAGVLLLLSESDGDWSIYLTKRSSALKHHPGQISFPGGKQDAADTDIVATALREANEEIGLPQGSTRVLGKLPSHETVTSFTITPVVAQLTEPFDPVRQESEVDEVFTVPLSHVLDPARFQVQARRWRGQMRAYYTVPFGPYYIWGATARILRGWADAVSS